MSSSICGQLRLEVTRKGNTSGETMFWPGDKINVRVSYVLFEFREVECIRVFLIGEEHTNLLNRAGILEGTNNMFLFKEKCLPCSSNINQNDSFNLTMQLPKNTPGTFRNKKGWVKYFIKACLFVKPGLQQKVHKAIIVGSIVDFNWLLEPTYMKPLTMVTEKEVRTILCFFVQKITMDVHLPKRAFVVGEQAKICIDIYNWSNKNVKRIELRIGQTIITKASPWMDAVCQEEEELLASNEIKGIIPVPMYSKQHYDLIVDIPPSAKIPNFSSCKLLNSSSWVMVVAYFGHCNIKMVAPIALGHVPIKGQTTKSTFRSVTTAPGLNRGHSPLQDEASSYDSKRPSTHSNSSGDSCRSSRPLIADSPRELPPSYEAACRQSQPKDTYPFAESLGFVPPARRLSIPTETPQRPRSPYGAPYPLSPSGTADAIPEPYQSTPYPLDTTGFYAMPLPKLEPRKSLPSHLGEKHEYHNPVPFKSQAPYEIGFAHSIGSYPPPELGFPRTTVPISCLLFMPGADDEPEDRNSGKSKNS